MRLRSCPGRALALAACVIVVAACAGLIGVSCADPGPFTLTVVPQSLRGDSIPGQQCVFLLTVAEEDGAESDAPVALSAVASGAQVTVVSQSIVAGQVGEIWVAPSSEHVGRMVEVTFRGTRGGEVREQAVAFAVAEGEDDRAAYAAELRDRFTTWLATQQLGSGVTPETQWQGTMVSPVWLVVSHYLFFSDEWEMHLSWHVMIAPDDWSRIELRRRFTETKPSLAFEIASVSANSEPRSIAPPDELWR